MNRNDRLGCLTPMGFAAGLIAILVLAGVAFAIGGQMFSPGALNAQSGQTVGGVNAHAQIRECAACHAAPWERATMADRCLECHVNVASQMSAVAGLHGIIAEKDPSLACRDCHKDHRGAMAPLTELGEYDFPHDAMGYSLEGHGQKGDGTPFECADCHADDVSSFASDSCLACHRQVDIAFAESHLLVFGEDCLVCHDGIDAYGDDFDHNDFSFPLVGKHADLSCSQCHLNARSVGDLQATLQDCYSCHYESDPHQFAYGAECQACHTAEGWTPAHFDHNLASFKLEGKHADAACETCHVNDVYAGIPTDCHSCHQQDDEHGGQFGTQCETCHNPSDWEDATFDHTLSAFKLDGAHAGAACESCHKNGVFKGTPSACVDCHAEPASHAGQFGADCSSCHSTSAWKPASYNGPHNFPMDHEGANGKCQTCHPDSLTTYTCYGCHEHNPAGIAAEHREEGISDFQDCMACHPTGREHEGGDD